MNATTETGMDLVTLQKKKAASTIDMGDGAFTSTWTVGRDKFIREEIVAYGRKSKLFNVTREMLTISDHSRIMTSAPVSIAIWKAFGLDKK